MSFANRLGPLGTRKREDHRPRVLRGVTDIDDSEQTETTPFVLLAVTPRRGSVINNCRVVLDLDAPTTGFGTIESTVTINFHVGRKVDGTNWRRGQAVLGTALTGTLSAGRSVEIDLGAVTEETRIYAVTSSDVADDIEIPFKVYYESTHEPTVTAVAAG